MIPVALNPLIDHFRVLRITPIVVGGYVRDSLLGIQSHDIDIELYGVDSSQSLSDLLKPFGNVCEVGKSYGVTKLRYDGYEIDFSLPRTETKTTQGHRGFAVKTYATIDFATAARRRDFTINAIGYNPITDTLLDPYFGEADLRAKKLRCVDPMTFVEDPLRILRAVQFVARFDLIGDPELLGLCRRMVEQGALEELPKERIFEEIKKLLLRSPSPSKGFALLKEMGGLIFFKELLDLEKTPQDFFSHPEGNVWIHTLIALDTMVQYKTGESKQDLILFLAILLHDIGKPCTTIVCDGILNAPKHAEAGVEPTRTFLERLTNEKELIERIVPLVRYHGAVRKLFQTGAEDSALRHLSTHVKIDDLIVVARADFYGRAFVGEIPRCFEAGEWLHCRAESLGILQAPPQPLLLGRDLIALGLSPSPAFKTLLDAAYTAQLDGIFKSHEEAVSWISCSFNSVIAHTV